MARALLPALGLLAAMGACGGIVAGGPSDGGNRFTGNFPTPPQAGTSSVVGTTASTSTSTSTTTFTGSNVTRTGTTTTTVGNSGLVIDDMAGSGPEIDLSPLLRARLAGDVVPGTWFTFTSDVPTSVIPNHNSPFFFTTVTPPPGVASSHAACLVSPGFVGFDAGQGFNFAINLATTPAAPTTFDTRPYTGVRFWAISLADAGSAPTIKIGFPDDQTSGAAATSTCNINLGNGQSGQCDDDFADAAEPLSPVWEQIVILFSDITQLDYGGVAGTFATWDAAHVYGMNFQVNGREADAGLNPPFGFCIADIEFVGP